MKEYRTWDQWETICNNALNGNWTDAAQNCVDYGFYANDMVNKWEEEEYHVLEDATDLALLAEMASEKRAK